MQNYPQYLDTSKIIKQNLSKSSYTYKIKLSIFKKLHLYTKYNKKIFSFPIFIKKINQFEPLFSFFSYIGNLKVPLSLYIIIRHETMLLRWIFFIFILFLRNLSFASHIIGGDISYKCLGNNTFEFTINFYQDCLDGEPQAIIQDNPAFYAIYTAGNQPTLFTSGEVRYKEKGLVDPNFSNDCINNYPNTCMQKQSFVFTKTLPPNPNGYYIVSQRCCRNASISNITNPGNVGISYYAKIPGWTGSNCTNNSPIFNKVPPQIICANNPFIYDFSAEDPDGDSLSYSLCYAKIGGSPLDPKPEGSNISPPPYNSVNYIPPYTANYPVSGIPPLQIDPITGIMTGTPNITGRFIVTVCVSEWRNNQIIAEYTRDIQFVITNCSKAVVANIPELADTPGVHQIVCDGKTVEFQNNSSGGFEYFWDFGVPGATSTEFEPIYTFPDTGKYNVKLVVNPGSTCADSIEKEVWIYPDFSTDFEWNGSLCPGDTLQFLDNSFSSLGNVNYWKWNFNNEGSSNEKDPLFSFDFPGGAKQVQLISGNDKGCKDSIQKELVIDFLDIDAGNDTIIVKGYPFHLQGSGANYYHWQPSDFLSDPYQAQPEVNFPDVGEYHYSLEGSTENGCKDTASVTITVVDKGTVFVPSGFSPNGDGVNDVFRPIIVGYAVIQYFKIYDRYGALVYQSHNKNNPEWDGYYKGGKKADVGTYIWEITVIDPFGKKEYLSGDVTLLR